jgi:hypothetical protein
MVFVVTKHPAAHGIPDRVWMSLGKQIRAAVT